jgi:hypothetical protein
MAERLHPGVYVDEVSSGIRPIEAVGTSTAAFVGEAARGMPGYPHFVASFDDYVSIFGGHTPGEKGLLAQAVQAFFGAGGQRAFVVRVLPSDAARAASSAVATRIGTALLPAAGRPNALSFQAKGAGAWAEALRIDIAAATHFKDEAFKIVVSSVEGGGLRVLETFDDVRSDPKHEDYYADVIKRTSKYIAVTDELLKDAMADAPKSLSAPERAPTSWLGKPKDDATGSGKHYTVYEDAKLTFRWKDNGSDADATEKSLSFNDVVKSAGKTFTNGAADLTPKQVTDAINALTSFRVVDHPDAAAGDGSPAGVQPALATRPYLYLTLPDAGSVDLTGATVKLVITVTGSPAQELSLAASTNVTAADLAGLIRTAAKDVAGLGVVARGNTVAVRGPRDEKGVALELSVTGGAGDPFTGKKLALPGHAGALVEHLDNVELTISEERNPASPSVLRNLGLSARARGYDEGSLANPDLRPAETSKIKLKNGSDGTGQLTADDYAGDEGDRTGLHALDDVEVNLVALPGKNAPAYLSKALEYVDRRGDCFFIADGPGSVDHDFDMSASEAKQFVDGLPARSKNAAIYFPWIEIPDPVGVGRNPTRYVPPSGHIAGVYARTDITRGVWKAPAGLEAGLPGVLDVQVNVRDADQDLLNPVGLNCVRRFSGAGIVSWGARTLSSDPEWRYVPVRRMALFLKESLRRGLQWAVFEPNDDRLWDQMRAVATSFMLGLFRQGAFQGTRPDEAFQVLCDRSTNPQVLVDQGIVTARVAFAPLKPAEFVVIEISQKSLVS